AGGSHREAHASRAAGRGLRPADSHEAAVGAGRGGNRTQPAGEKRQASRRGDRTGVMSGEFEYAIRKDVRNNPIVREVDREGNSGMCSPFAAAGSLFAG